LYATHFARRRAIDDRAVNLVYSKSAPERQIRRDDPVSSRSRLCPRNGALLAVVNVFDLVDIRAS
jgi:hypothetical protein